jgi:hypothetical protein
MDALNSFKLSDESIDFTLTEDVISFKLLVVTEESDDFRLLEDGDFRLLEDDDFRLLE